MAEKKRQISIFLDGKQVDVTVKNLTAAFRKASNELANMVVGSEEYINKLEEVKGLNSELQAHRKALSGIAEGYTLTKAGVDKFVGVAAGAFAVETVFAFGRELFNTAGKMELLAKKAKTVFGDSLPQITKEAEKNATAMGLTNAEYIASAAAIQDLLVPMGFQRKEAAGISAQLVNLSGALSEWSGGQRSAEEVTQILSAALLGERDSLKGLGIDLKQSEIDSELAARGLSSLTGESKKQAEAAVTLDLIMRKSVDAQNAFAEGSDSLTRQQAELAAQIKQIAQAISTILIPVFNSLIGIVTFAAEGIEGMVDPAKQASKEFDEQAAKVAALDKNLVPLLDRYDQLIAKTNPTKAEQKELGEVIKQIGDITPGAITEIDKYGDALSINAGKSREFLEAERARLKFVNAEAIKATQEAKENAEKQIEIIRKQVASGKKIITEASVGGGGAFGAGSTLPQAREVSLTAQEIQDLTQKVAQLAETAKGADAEIKRLTGTRVTPEPAPHKPTGGGTGGTDKGKSKGEKPLTPEEEKEIIKRFKERQEAIQNLQALVTQTTQTTQAEFAKTQQAEFETLASTNEAKLNLDLNYEQEKAEVQERIRQTLLTDQEAEIESLNLHYQYLLQLADRYGIDRTALEKQHRDKLQAVSDKYDKEGAQKAYDANQTRLKELAESFIALGDLVTATANVFADESERTSAISKVATLAKIAFDTAAAITSLVAASEANPGNPFTFGGAGIAQYAAGIVRILANIAQARKILSGAPKVQQKFEGGAVVPVTGAQDGRTYHAAPIGAPGTGLLPSFPVLLSSMATGGPILASERGAEYFVSASDLRNPRVADHVRMIDTITRSRVSQFAEGGLNAAQPGGAGATTAASIDPAIIINNTMAIQALVQVLQQGILAIVPDITITDIAKRLKTLNTASGGFFS